MADVQKIKELRTRTGAGIDQCRAALEKAGGDLVGALAVLGVRVPRERPADVVLSAGLVHTYNHLGRISVIVQINCETDFVARSEVFTDFATAVAIQVAANNPRYIDQTDKRGWAEEEDDAPIPLAGTVSGEPSEVLLEQAWVSDESKTVRQLLDELKLKVGEGIRITRVVRVELAGDMTVLPFQGPRA